MSVSIYPSRKVDHDEAREALTRILNTMFHRPDGDKARIGIPARPDYDDDLILAGYIQQQRDAEQKR